MTRFILATAIALCAAETNGQTVAFLNNTGIPVNVFVREDGDQEFRLVRQGLNNRFIQRVNVTRFPYEVSLAPSDNDDQFKNFGPFQAKDNRVEFTRRDIFEEKIGRRLVFDCRSGQWVSRTLRYTVVRPEFQVRMH